MDKKVFIIYVENTKITQDLLFLSILFKNI